ncbi:MAG: hypothetical protein HKN32_03570, partial [Flavobacteriales bacterium]|nr:hypothetical protein [Flavobacteriales bacterium]
VTSIIDSTGAVQERFAYSAYGEPTFLDSDFVEQSDSVSDWSRLFATYEFDTWSNWYQVRHRVLVSRLGWTQRDTFPSINLVSYTPSPQNTTDPTGEFVFITVITIGGVSITIADLAIAGSVAAYYGYIFTHHDDVISACEGMAAAVGDLVLVDVVLEARAWDEVYSSAIEVIQAIRNKKGGPCEYYLAWCLWGPTTDQAQSALYTPFPHSYWPHNTVKQCWDCYAKCYLNGEWPYERLYCHAHWDQGPQYGRDKWPDAMVDDPYQFFPWF